MPGVPETSFPLTPLPRSDTEGGCLWTPSKEKGSLTPKLLGVPGRVLSSSSVQPIFGNVKASYIGGRLVGYGCLACGSATPRYLLSLCLFVSLSVLLALSHSPLQHPPSVGAL